MSHALKLEAAIKALGSRYCLHPANHVKIKVQTRTKEQVMHEALAGLVYAVSDHVNEQGAGGFLLARLADARDALRHA